MDQLRQIPIIWFSGLHRSGKWTEIDLLLNFFIENWYNPFVRKWHGTREWLGKEESDPNSERWQINSPKLKNRTTTNFDKLRMEAAEKLQTELSTSYNALQIAPVAKPVILLDRTLISLDNFYDFIMDFIAIPVAIYYANSVFNGLGYIVYNALK